MTYLWKMRNDKDTLERLETSHQINEPRGRNRAECLSNVSDSISVILNLISLKIILNLFN